MNGSCARVTSRHINERSRRKNVAALPYYGERGNIYRKTKSRPALEEYTSATLPQARRERVGSRVAVDRVGVLLVGRASSSLGRVVVK